MKNTFKACVLWSLLGSAAWGLDVPTYLPLDSQFWLMYASNDAQRELDEYPHDRHIFSRLQDEVGEFSEALYDSHQSKTTSNTVDITQREPLLKALSWLHTQLSLALYEAQDYVDQGAHNSAGYYQLCLEIVELAEIYITLERLGGYAVPGVRQVVENLFHFYLQRALALYGLLYGEPTNVEEGADDSDEEVQPRLLDLRTMAYFFAL